MRHRKTNFKMLTFSMRFLCRFSRIAHCLNSGLSRCTLFAQILYSLTLRSCFVLGIPLCSLFVRCLFRDSENSEMLGIKCWYFDTLLGLFFNCTPRGLFQNNRRFLFLFCSLFVRSFRSSKSSKIQSGLWPRLPLVCRCFASLLGLPKVPDKTVNSCGSRSSFGVRY